MVYRYGRGIGPVWYEVCGGSSPPLELNLLREESGKGKIREGGEED